LIAAAAIVGAVALFGNGLAGPAPLALAGAGGFIAWGAALWRPDTRQQPPGRGDEPPVT
jgi:hypothetical protein